MKKLLLFFMLIPLGFAFGQSEEEVFTIVEKMPLFGVCDKQKNDESFKSYYKEASNCSVRNIESHFKEEVAKIRNQFPAGTFKSYIRFIVEEDGSVSNEIVKISSGNTAIDNAALNIVKNMDQWQAGSQRGRKVRVQYVLPVFFD